MQRKAKKNVICRVMWHFQLNEFQVDPGHCFLRAKHGDRVKNISSLIIYDCPSKIDATDSVVFWSCSPQVLVADAGEYCLVFDNSYSWFKSKQIYYWYHLACGDKSTCS